MRKLNKSISMLLCFCLVVITSCYSSNSVSFLAPPQTGSTIQDIAYRLAQKKELKTLINKYVSQATFHPSLQQLDIVNHLTKIIFENIDITSEEGQKILNNIKHIHFKPLKLRWDQKLYKKFFIKANSDSSIFFYIFVIFPVFIIYISESLWWVPVLNLFTFIIYGLLIPDYIPRGKFTKKYNSKYLIYLKPNVASTTITHEFGHFIASLLDLRDLNFCFGNAFQHYVHYNFEDEIKTQVSFGIGNKTIPAKIQRTDLAIENNRLKEIISFISSSDRSLKETATSFTRNTRLAQFRKNYNDIYAPILDAEYYYEGAFIGASVKEIYQDKKKGFLALLSLIPRSTTPQKDTIVESHKKELALLYSH